MESAKLTWKNYFPRSVVVIILLVGSLIALMAVQAWYLERLITRELIDIRFALTLEAIIFIASGIGIYYLSRKYFKSSSQVADRLSEREQEVFKELIAGKTNNEIMESLFIEKSTLKTHINRIYKKLDIENRAELKRRYS